MRTTGLVKYSVYSGSYLVHGCADVRPIKYPGMSIRLVRYLLSVPGRIWRAICFKVILITVFSLFCGFVVGAIWVAYETDSYEEYESKIDWLLYEAEI